MLSNTGANKTPTEWRPGLDASIGFRTLFKVSNIKRMSILSCSSVGTFDVIPWAASNSSAYWGLLLWVRGSETASTAYFVDSRPYVVSEPSII